MLPLVAALLAFTLAAPASPAAPAAAAPKGRGNPVLARGVRTPVVGVAAAVRMGVLVGNGGVFVQPPLGFGFGLDLRYHALPIGAARLGFELQAGHDRFGDRRSFVVDQDGVPTTVVRPLLLSHTDLTLGPSLQIPARVLFIELGGGVGLAVSSFRRPWSERPQDDEQVVGYDALVRGDAALAIPIVRDQGIRLGVAVNKIFSKRRVIGDPSDPAATPDTAVFDLYLDVVLAYQAWF